MFIKKIGGPRVVKLPDGTMLSRADLPPPETTRWVASRKAIVTNAVRFGLLTQEEAMERYDLTEEELDEWSSAIERHGIGALKATALQRYRQL